MDGASRRAALMRTPWQRPSARALQHFLHTEAGGSALLLAATAIALVWANSPASDSYDELWETVLTVDLGGHRISEDLRHWVNDGLMVFFFYVVGLEIRRELSLGQLQDRRQAAVPAVAALAGMVVPALLYLALNPSGEAARGWGVVMATDIAFALGALAVLGPRCPGPVRVFLLTLAIVDDIGAIIVIALFYTSSLEPLALVGALAVLLGIGLLRRIRIWRGPAYFAAGVLLWLCMVESGVHPTIAGVLLGLMTAVHAPRRQDVERATTLTRSFRQSPTASQGRSAMLGVAEALSPNERLQEALHPWTSYVIVPVFALANAGVALDADAIDAALGSAVTFGIVLGLVVGKLAGISLSTVLAVRLRVGTLPEGLHQRQVVGVGALAGIGFTVSLFVIDLAFEDDQLREEAKVGVLMASLIAAVLGWAIFALAARSGHASPTPRPHRLSPPVDRAHDHVLGPEDAPLTLVEYGDYECPFCASATGAIDELRRTFGDELRYVFRHAPNPDRHPHARLAAEAVEAAGDQGRFWEMHDRVFAEPDRLQLDDLLGHAQALGLDVERFAEALRDGVHAATIDADIDSAEASGVTGTPTFFIGGRRHDGPHDAVSLADALRTSRSE